MAELGHSENSVRSLQRRVYPAGSGDCITHFDKHVNGLVSHPFGKLLQWS